MRYFDLPVLKGIFKDYHRRSIPDTGLADGKNIIFDENRVKRRWGYGQLGTNLPLNGEVTGFYYYDHLRDATEVLVCTTTRDTYYYDDTTDTWKFCTKIYILGTAQCAGGVVNVFGDGLGGQNWAADLGGAPTWMQIGFEGAGGMGTNDANDVVTWYDIATCPGAAAMTLQTNGPNTGGLVNYVVRMCWSGTIDEAHSFEAPVSITTNEKLLVIDNGIEAPQKWDANTLPPGAVVANYCQDLGGTPNITRYMKNYYDHLVFGWIIDTGVDFPQTFHCAPRGDPEGFGAAVGSYFYELLDGDDEITGMELLRNELIIYKEDSVARVRRTGITVNPFEYEENILKDIGTRAGRTIVIYGDAHLFMGNGDDVWAFDGVSHVPIGTDQQGVPIITQSLFGGLNSEYMNRCFAFPLYDKYLYMLFTVSSTSDYPDQTYVYDWKQKVWEYWEFAHQMTAAGNYYENESLTWNDIAILYGVNNTGNVTTGGAGNRTVTVGGGGAFNVAWNASGALLIKFANPYTAAGTWYRVAQIDNAGQLTLDEDGPVYGPGVFNLGWGPTWQEWEGRWRDKFITADTPTLVMGDKDGYVYEANFTQDTDDGANIEAFFETRDYPLKDLDGSGRHHTQDKKILDMTIGAQLKLAGEEVRVKISTDYGQFWSDWRTIDMGVGGATFIRFKRNFNSRGREVRARAENIDGAPFEIESMTIGFVDAGRGGK